jgi:hypothetical protein
MACVGIFACGDNGEKYAPGAPTLLNTIEQRELSWDPIAGASSYNLYIKAVEDCPDIQAAEFQQPTKSDTKIEDVISPFSIEAYDGCTTCYYAALAARNEAGEGDLSNAVGWQIRPQPCP